MIIASCPLFNLLTGTPQPAASPRMEFQTAGRTRRRPSARVDYELTQLGLSLLPLQKAVKEWAETDIDAVHRARSAYDERVAHPAAG